MRDMTQQWQPLEHLFADTGHLRHALVRAEGAKLLWLNKRAAQHDPNFASVGHCHRRYGDLLLDRCAFLIGDDGAEPSIAAAGGVEGIADRYGGDGIGSNGGSGRAVFLHGYYVKGVGRTRLIGAGVDVSHASGGAYLEEAVREAIFAEVIDSEFPHGAVPVLAIIDTGQEQIWQTPAGPKRETRVLIVRPAFLRPAHFERATAFDGPAPLAGVADADRVGRMFGRCGESAGAEALAQRFRQFWVRWAQQLAYGFAHRLSHSGLSTSNVTLGGALVDFGASSALPCWGRIVTIGGYPPCGTELGQLVDALNGTLFYHERFGKALFGNNEVLHEFYGTLSSAYFETLVVEMVRLCGYSREAIIQALSGENGKIISSIVGKHLGKAQKRWYDIIDFTPALDYEDGDGPRDILRCIRDDVIAEFPDSCARADSVVLEYLSNAMAEPRAGLYREELKYRLYPQVEAGKDKLDSLISAAVLAGRRDSRVGMATGLPIGFAGSDEFSIALFWVPGQNRIYGIVEWITAGKAGEWYALGPDVMAGCHIIVAHIKIEELCLGGDGCIVVSCSIAMCPGWTALVNHRGVEPH